MRGARAHLAEIEARDRADKYALATRSTTRDYLIAAIAEDHEATLIHYDGDFDRLAQHT
jgi:predicted nucleic acid-binding protein